MEFNNKPNFLIVGASKSGTTSIAKYLYQHPQIFFNESVKEPRYFVRQAINEISIWDPMNGEIKRQSILEKKRYFNLFSTDIEYNRYGEKSIHYFNHPELAIKNIKNEIGDIPIIISLRNPVDRMISNWKYLAYELFDLDFALNLENKRKDFGYNSFWLYKYQSFYADKINLFLENFSNVLVIIFEEFAKNPQKILRDCTDFLDVTNYDFNVNEKHNPERSHSFIKSSYYTYIKSKYIYFILVKILHKYSYIKKYQLFVRKTNKVIEKNKYISIFANDIQKTEDLLNRNLSIWKNS